MHKSLYEARAMKLPTAFLCHSHKDKTLIKGLIALWDEAGWDVYVDWADPLMPETPTNETAHRIRKQIDKNYYFIFLATSNSMGSRWCPWEIGYADGKKPTERIIFIPTVDDINRYHGSEYLNLYPHMDLSDDNILGVWQPDQRSGVRLKDLRG